MRKIFTFLFAALMSVGMFATTVTWDNSTLSSIYIYDGQSFTQDGVTVTSLIGMIYGENGQWMGNSNDASFKFSTSLGNFTKIEITATIHSFGGSGWTQTSPGAVWTGEANETTFGEYLSNVSQIVFTIGDAVPSWVKSGDEWDDATKTLTVNGNPVSNAYINVSDIENLVISDAVTSIGDNAFESCTGLKSVAFGSNLASIGNSAFSSCIKLESVTFPASLQSIGKTAFSQCYALTSVTINNGLTSIGQRAYYNCEKLASVTIPSSVTEIGSSAFGNCEKLTEIVVAAENPNYSSADGVLFDKAKTTLIQCPCAKQGEYTIPNSVTSIGNNALSSCYLLTSVEIPNSVGEIGSQAFSSCSELTSVTIGNGVTSIGSYAFYYSSKLASVTISATTPPTLGSEALGKTAAALKIYVPAESVDDYKGAWTAYADKIEAAAPADPNREYLSLDPSVWTWGYNSVPEAVAGGIKTTIISDWGALSMGWDPERDLSEWDKIVFEVSHMDGCAGNWFKLKAYLRDESDSEGKQMEGLLGLDAPDNELNYLVIDLHQQVEGFDLTKARVLAVQCEPTGGIFTISSAYLLKESEPSAIDNTVLTEKAKKVVVDGMIYIVRDGKLFNLQGAQVR